MENIRTGGIKDWRNQEMKVSGSGEIQGLEDSRSEGFKKWRNLELGNQGLQESRTIEILDFRKSKLKY